MTKAIIYKH